MRNEIGVVAFVGSGKPSSKVSPSGSVPFGVESHPTGKLIKLRTSEHQPPSYRWTGGTTSAQVCGDSFNLLMYHADRRGTSPFRVIEPPQWTDHVLEYSGNIRARVRRLPPRRLEPPHSGVGATRVRYLITVNDPATTGWYGK